MNDLPPARPHVNGKGVLVTPARLHTTRQVEETKALAAGCAYLLGTVARLWRNRTGGTAPRREEPPAPVDNRRTPCRRTSRR